MSAPLPAALAREGAGILAGGRVHPEVQAQITATRGHGGRLPPAVGAEMAAAFGHGFGDVRVHSDALSDALARSVQARAFTTGSDIYFASGEYQPSTRQGRDLLAHELAHVVQQRAAPTAGELRVSEPGDELEREAQHAAAAVSGGGG